MRKRFKELIDWATRELKSLAGKELFKYLILSAGTLLGGSIIGIIKRLVNRPFDLEQFKDHPYDSTIGILRTDPVHSLSGLFLIALIITFLFLLRRAGNRFKEQAGIVEEGRASRTLATEAGLGGRWPHARVVDGGAPWPDLKSEILRRENNLLYILGANGIGTFGRPGSPLYDTLRQFTGTTRVILLKPGSPEVYGRSYGVGENPQEYNEAIMASVNRLKDLRKQQHPIEGRHYAGQLNWKLLITNRTIWMQYYMPGGSHVDETPVWRFDVTPNDGCLYKYFYLEFDRIWRRCEPDPMTLY